MCVICKNVVCEGVVSEDISCEEAVCENVIRMGRFAMAQLIIKCYQQYVDI